MPYIEVIFVGDRWSASLSRHRGGIGRYCQLPLGDNHYLARVRDHTGPARLARALAEESLQVEAARQRPAIGLPTHLSGLGEFDAHAFSVFLGLLGEALSKQAGPESILDGFRPESARRKSSDFLLTWEGNIPLRSAARRHHFDGLSDRCAVVLYSTMSTQQTCRSNLPAIHVGMKPRR